MISAVNSSPSFTSVMPVRVFIDGLETFDEKLIRSSCRQLSNVLAGPSSKDPKLSIIRKFGYFDKDYSVTNGFHGHPKKDGHKNIHPSDFFRCIIDRGRTFFVTGPQAEKLHELGKAVGEQRGVCKERGVKTSFDLTVAKRNYARKISDFLSSAQLRVAEITKDQRWNPLTLIVNMTSNKKYGLSTFKMNLSDIDFSRTLQ